MIKYITKDQIRKGDTIRVSLGTLRGVSVALTGTADSKDADGDWKTKDNGHLTLEYDDITSIELLERPLPTEPGSVFRATEIRGEKCDVTVMVCEWRALVTYASSSSVARQTVHDGYDINAWEPLDG